MSCNGCRFVELKGTLNCDEKPLPKGVTYCTQLAKNKLEKRYPNEIKQMRERDAMIIKSALGPNDRNFE